MPYDLTNVQNYTLADKTYNQNTRQSQPDVRGTENLVPIAWQASLTTRTSGTDGSLTMNNPAHLILAGAKIDLYWLDPVTLAPKSCRAALVGAVAGAVVPFTGALGTPLPPALTAMQAAVVQVYDISGSIIGDNAAAVLGGVDTGPAATIVLFDNAAAEALVMNIVPSGCYAWLLGAGPNPIAGKTLETSHFSHNDIGAARNVRFAVQLTE